jgi:hypothetical protein
MMLLVQLSPAGLARLATRGFQAFKKLLLINLDFFERNRLEIGLGVDFRDLGLGQVGDERGMMSAAASVTPALEIGAFLRESSQRSFELVNVIAARGRRPRLPKIKEFHVNFPCRKLRLDIRRSAG